MYCIFDDLVSLHEIQFGRSISSVISVTDNFWPLENTKVTY